MKKRVILHIGFHKTGSSALQAFLSGNAERLAREGIGYPYPDPEHIVATGGCSGNAVQILYKGGFMEGAGVDANVRERISDSYFDALLEIIKEHSKSTVLISGEILSTRLGKNFSSFIDKLRIVSDVEIVCFVRDPFDFVFSSWRQRFKTSMKVPDFPEHLRMVSIGEAEASSMLMGFEYFHGVGVPLKVINYDYNKKNVASAFMSAIGYKNMSDEVAPSGIKEANLSLTPSEVCLAQITQEKIKNSDFTAAFIRTAQSRDRRVSLEYYNRRQHQQILDSFGDTIRLINSHLPEGQRLATEVRDREDADFVILPEDAALLLDLVNKLITERPKIQGYLPVEPHAGVPSLPLDFDREAYLLHNPDVAAAGMDPAQHWQLHGCRENRRYKLF